MNPSFISRSVNAMVSRFVNGPKVCTRGSCSGPCSNTPSSIQPNIHQNLGRTFVRNGCLFSIRQYSSLQRLRNRGIFMVGIHSGRIDAPYTPTSPWPLPVFWIPNAISPMIYCRHRRLRPLTGTYLNTQVKGVHYERSQVGPVGCNHVRVAGFLIRSRAGAGGAGVVR